MSKIVPLILFTIIAGLIVPARASEDRQEDPALWLARACVAEISLAFRQEVPKKKRLKQKLEECRLMWWIQLEKAEAKGIDMVAQVKQYNSLFKTKPHSRRYVFHLNPEGTEPEGWRANADWGVYRDTWLNIYEAAKEFSLDPGKHPCPAATEYGGRCDDNQHACDQTPVCWERKLCGRPLEWWSQAYYKADYRTCRRGATIPASVAAGEPMTRAAR